MIIAIHVQRKETWWITFCKIILQSTKWPENNHYYRLRVDKYGWKIFIEADGRNAVVWHLASLQTVLDFTLQLCFDDTTKYNSESIILVLSIILCRYHISMYIYMDGYNTIWPCNENGSHIVIFPRITV